ncbi:MAG: hypothetical protein QOG03_1147 [Actinomycetota bacterium]|jgi:hypothetical protein|nr:hypothetical protein [Actinomycetota bacterium]
MSDPVDPQSPPPPPVEPVPVYKPPTASEPTFAEPAATSWASADQPSAPALDEPTPEPVDDQDDQDDHDEDDADYPVRRTAPWIGMVTATGLGLAIIAVVEVVIFISQGLSTQAAGISTMLRMGGGFYSNLDNSQLEILLLLATILLVLPAIGDQGTTEGQDRSAALGFALTSAFAVIIGVAAVLAVLFELKLFHLQSPGQALPSQARRLLAGYLVRHLGLSVVVLVASLGAMKARFAPPAEVADDPALTEAA